MAKFIITGVEAIDRALKGLEPRLARKLLKSGMRTALKPLLARIKAAAPVGRPYRRKGKEHKPGTLKKALKIRAAKRTRKGTIGINIVMGEGDFKGESFYGSFQEYGTKKMPGKHFMKNAFESDKERVRTDAIDEILRLVDEAVAEVRVP